MKKIIIILLIFMFILVNILACQYRDPVYQTYTDLFFYENGIKLEYKLIEIKDFQQGATNPYWSQNNVPAKFKVYNNHPSKRLLVSILFNKNGVLDNQTIEIDPLGYTEIVRTPSDNIDFDTIRFSLSDPSITYQQEEVKVQTGEICKICPNGKECLDDGATCNINIECGAEICNPDSKCGEFSGICSEGKMLCKAINKCVITNIIGDGKPYSCEEECTTGTFGCSGICRATSSKNAGQKYYCIKECKSGRGKEDVCLKSIEEWVYWVIGIIILVLIIIFFFWKYGYEIKIKQLEKEFNDAMAKAKKLEDDVKELGKKGVDLKEIITKNEELIFLRGKEVSSLNEIIFLKEKEFKSVDGNIKQKLEETLRKYKNKRKEIEDEINKLKEKNKERELEIIRARYLGQKEEENKLNEEKKETAEILGISKERLILDGEYFRWKESMYSGKGEFAHITIYKKNILNGDPIPQGYEIHHIDGRHRNNQIWNLILLKKEDHKNFKHISKSWKSGIQQLKEQLRMKESDFPEHIQKKLKE